ncbi:hypothetical protein BD324DRAFT_648148 [Kockovaella imperatae]|uniref:Histone-lysine N-methyltransferase SET5 n=1 Tax=Kockovaella imperatae TaxID=4999 RepID=A0A1Y1UTD1_9TREE|nr:hypothetical protein BD324DRAFT_648148 [Kockovaella imperatae]ORX41271.1 hypothetical protein BD324DRAFT_648148 [Kockovaella imperatae]
MTLDPSPPSDELFLPFVTTVRRDHPSLGIPKLLALLKTQQPEWSVSEKRLRKAVQSLTLDEQGRESMDEPGLVATTGLDPSITSLAASTAPKVKVRMFGGEKGKGLVARERIHKGEVVWQEEPWIVTSSPQLYSALLGKQMCSHCFFLFSRPSPPMSAPCPHCDQAVFCNRLCASKASSSSHPDLLCPGLNPAAQPLWKLIRDTNGRYLETAAKIVAKWRWERELGDKGKAKEIEQRVWNGMARVSMEEREKEKKEWKLFAELKRGEWKHAHSLLLQALNPSEGDKSYKVVQKLLTKASKRSPIPLSEGEIQRWFSMDSFLELLGLAALNSEDSGGLYALHAHLNHACEPNIAALNLSKAFVPPSSSELPCEVPDPSQSGPRGTNKLTLLARRTINPGEELTIPYVNFNMPRGDRRQMLRESYGFWCDCPKCKREEGKEREGDDLATSSKESTREMIDKMKSMQMFQGTGEKVDAR